MAEHLSNVELVMWSLPTDTQPLIETVRRTLADHAFVAGRAEDVPTTTAFRRALAELKTDELTPVAYTRKADGRLCGQLDAHRQTPHGLERERVALFELTDKDGPQTTYGNVDLTERYRVALSTYTGADLSKIVRAVLDKDGLGAYSPRRGGAVYFAPVRSKDMLDRLEAFCQQLRIRFLRYTIPNTDAHRAEIAEAVADSIRADLQTHREAIAAYEETTRPHIFEQRGEAIDATARMIDNLSHLIEAHVQRLALDVAAIRQELATAQQKAEQAAQQNTYGARRRIVTTNTTSEEGSLFHAAV